MTPNPTTATRSQAMRHIVGAPALPYMNGCYMRQLLAVAPEGSGGGCYGTRLRKGAEGGSYWRWRRKVAEGGATSALVLRARSERQGCQERAPTPSKRRAGASPNPRSGPA